METLTKRRTKLHYGWIVVLVTFFTLIVSAGIRSVPSIFMLPFEKEFGWGRADVSSVVSINIFLYGLMGPFSAALMERFGTRRVVLISLICIAASLSLTPMITALWQFDLLWGVVVGLGTGSLANVLGVTIANRWFIQNKGVVVGILTASAATGQLLFLPVLAKITVDVGWRYAIYTAIAVIAVLIPVVRASQNITDFSAGSAWFRLYGASYFCRFLRLGLDCNRSANRKDRIGYFRQREGRHGLWLGCCSAPAGSILCCL
ncbi:MFS transporter [Paenibacillus alginolyticus]|uniref:MFS transporter n=1 Tax=Paenibacillus alginolyticus TaxID=59839 RepID=UPI0028A5BB4E|nr:MFS transporter [Paenibacillus frigoriresistens]